LEQIMPRGRPFAPGQSGNVKGRPRGSKNRKSLILEELEKDGSELAQLVKDLARGGDSTALSIWMSRLEPIARQRGEHVEFDFDPRATPAENITKVLEAVAAGELTLDQGSVLITSLEKLATARAALEVADKESELIAAFKEIAAKVPV
jgi:hypothetical protein